MQFHRLAKYFPSLEGEDFDLLVESIRKNGQRVPIVTHEGKILDGINRYRACERLGIEPEHRELPEGTDPLQYVVDMNVRRRHMDTSQRAMLATEMLPEFEAVSHKRKLANLKNVGNQIEVDEIDRSHREQPYHYQSREDAAKVFGVSGPTIQRAKRVKEQAPEKVADIVAGRSTVASVDAELRAKQAAGRAEHKREAVTEKKVEEKPRFVADYFDATKLFIDEIELAIAGAQRHKFDPASKNFVTTKHDKIRELMNTLEGLV